ncbi:MAG: type IV pilus twitching motility protein PilT [Elusimicrobiota bacterium]
MADSDITEAVPAQQKPNLVSILTAGLGLGASDIHLTVGRPPMVRVNGELIEMSQFLPLDAESCRKMIYSCLYEKQRAEFEAQMDLDCSIRIKDAARFRINVLRQRGAAEAVFRVIPETIPTPEFLGLGPNVMSLADYPHGLILVTGPTGSGKSTTMACLIEKINQNHRKHIITIEDPIEFVYERKMSVIRQREVGVDTRSFGHALRQALRQDPDVLLIGEMRDVETISLALTAAETGHLCFATLHTADSAQSIDRIVDVFPAEQQQQIRVQLSNSLKGVVSQVLLPRADGNGMVAAREFLSVTAGVAHQIRDGKSHMIKNMIETGGRAGMFSLEKSLAELARSGVVDPKEAAVRMPPSGDTEEDAGRFGINRPLAEAVIQ